MSKFFALCITFVVVQVLHGVNGMDCTLGTSKNVFDKFINSCPRVLIDSPEEEYCCVNAEGEVHCCNIYEFAVTSLTILIPLIIGILIISFIISCICCLCCPFCCMYKRRSGGRVLQPGTVVTVGPYAVPPNYNYVSTAGAYNPYRPLTGQNPSYIP